jgi:hypothetical protein
VAAQSQEDPRIGELSYLDRQFMAQQRALLEDLVARNFGRRFSGVRDNDLELLQMLLDRQVVRANQTRELQAMGVDQTRELQAMGVVMGDLLASEFALKWVVYEDHLGRSRALRNGDSDIYLFPITMISRRREVDNRTPVVDIYRKAAEQPFVLSRGVAF